MMRVIGLTGGIGTGKSTVAQFLSGLGAVILDVDTLGHEALLQGSSVYDELVATFGQEILTPDGRIDRKRLGTIVFASHELLLKLNRIVHPWMREAMKARIDACRKQGIKVLILDAAILIEAGWTSLVDEVWVTAASQETVLKRLKGREGLSEAESLARIRHQLPSDERVKHANVVIDTDCSLAELKARVEKLWRDIHKHTEMS
ncbi:MAG: dephospho-CoA kinase [Chloroflexota bacterium]